MSVKIITKHETGGTGDEPLSTDLEKGELGVNTVDGKLWVGDGASKKLLTGGGGLIDGLADGNTLRWEDSTSEWEATSNLVVADTGSVTAKGDITATTSFRYGTNLHLVNTSTGGTSWSINSSGQDSVLGAGNLELSVTSQGPKAVLKANGDFTASKFIGDGSLLTNLPITSSQWDDVTGGISYTGGNVNIASGNLTLSGTVDGRDVAADGTKLDGIATSANNYTHPSYASTNINTSGATIVDIITTNSTGHVTQLGTRTLTAANIGAQATIGNDLTFTRGGGWFMSDTTWVRSKNNKGVYNASTATNAFATPGDFTAGYSDMRLKTHLGTIPDALDKVCSLEGFYYERNDKAVELGYTGGERRVGLSAQDVQAVLPEVVKDAPINIDNGTDYLTIDYERVVPLLVEAIKAQQIQIDELKRNQK